MTEEVKNKLSSFFEERLRETREFYSVISDYFSVGLTDLILPTFEEFLENLRDKTLYCFINTSSNRNNYGSYSVDRDYYETHKNDPFLDNITDLGIIDFCTNSLTNIIPTSSILIRFPEVTVTNENDKSIDIKDLFVKIAVKGNRMRGSFKMIRTTYNVTQWLSNYSHSHIPRISHTEVPEWQFPCLGSGPLNSTIEELKAVYDKDFLELFCLELSKYVTVESLAGVPYIKLETVGANNARSELPATYRGTINRLSFVTDFIKYFVKNTSIKFSYVNGNYALGEPLLDFWIKISNCFIEWFNNLYNQGEITYTFQDLKDNNVIVPFVISEGKAYRISNNPLTSIEELNGADMFVFKGRMQHLSIEGYTDININKTILLSSSICSYIITCILKLINCKYGRINSEERKNEVSKKCHYL